MAGILLTCLCLFQMAQSVTHHYDDPTLEELARGYTVKARPDWGRQAREQRSLRIACIGGSNTQGDEDYAGYVHLLDTFVKDRLGVVLYEEHSHPDSVRLRDHSYAHNLGFSGRGVEYYVGKIFNFESYGDLREWPNVILIETAVNILEGTLERNDTSVHLERFVRSVNYKFARVGLPPPDYLFYNMPYYFDLMNEAQGRKTFEERRQHIAEFDSQRSAYRAKKQIELFAAHYGMPVLDWGDAMFPALIRHYLNSTKSFVEYPWKYTADGTHMSKPIGTSIGQHHLLGPFFVDVMRPNVDRPSRPEPPRLYPPSPILFEIFTFTTYEREGTTLDLRGAFSEHEQLEWKELPIPHYYYCYGSRVKGGRGVMDISAPAQCTRAEPCSIQIHMYHSWNTSRVGNSTCTLHPKGQFDKQPLPGGTIEVDGQSVVGKATFPVVHTFPYNVTSAGEYSVKCVNQDDRLSCATSLDINKTLWL